MRAALRLLEGEPSGGPLPLDQCTNECTNDGGKTVLDVLKSKHPPPNHAIPVDLETIRGQEPQTIIFDQIDGSLIRSTVQKTDGAAGLPLEAIAELSEIKSEVHQEKRRELASMEASVLESLSNPIKKAKELASEKGASSWLTALRPWLLPPQRSLPRCPLFEIQLEPPISSIKLCVWLILSGGLCT